MSALVDTKKKWADEDSDSSDDEVETEEQVESPKVEEAAAVAANNDDSSDSESESDEDDTEPLDLSKVTISAPVVKKVDVKLLSKKEQKELKKKELDDLDSILAGFVPEVTTPVENVSTPASVPASEGGDADKKKKNNKKKKPTGAKKAETPVEAAKDDEVVVVKDIKEVMKSRTSSSKGSSKGANVSDAQRIALAEAKAVADGNKKKKVDKSKFCEGTY